MDINKVSIYQLTTMITFPFQDDKITAWCSALLFSRAHFFLKVKNKFEINDLNNFFEKKFFLGISMLLYLPQYSSVSHSVPGLCF